MAVSGCSFSPKKSRDTVRAISAPGDASSAAVTSKCVVVPFNKMLVHLRREEMTNHFVEWHHDELSDGLRALGLVEIEKRYSRPPCLCISVGR